MHKLAFPTLVCATLPLSLATAALAQTVSFAPFTTVAADDAPAVLQSTSRDVTGDGINDIVFVGRLPDGTQGLYLSVGLGARAYGPAASIPSPEVLDAFPFAGDVDQDGDMDVFAVTQSLQLLALRNEGGGAFSIPNATTQPTEEIRALGDVDGDGDLDLLLRSGGENQLASFDPGSWSFQLTPIPASGQIVAASDLNGDGRAEVIAFAPNLVVFPGGSGGLGGPIQVGSGPAAPLGPLDVYVTDFNGDGHLDLGSTRSGPSQSVFVGDGALGFIMVPILPPVLSNPPSDVRRFIDANGDGILDLLYLAPVNGDPFDSRTYLSIGNGVLPFPEGTLAGAALSAASNAAFTPPREFQDVDGDGATDRISSGLISYGPFASLPLGFDDPAPFLDASGLGAPTASPRAIDVNSDDRLDLVIVEEPARTLSWYRNLGELEFSRANVFNPAGTTIVDYDTGPWESGRPDILVELRGTPVGNELRVWRDFGGTGLLATPPVLTTTNRVLGIGDLDGDGSSEIVVEGGYHTFDSNGDLGLRVDVAAFAFAPTDRVALDDIDSDGDLDLVSWAPSALAARPVQVVANVSNAQSFSAPSSVTNASGRLELADVNGDGLTDIVQGRLGSAPSLDVRFGQGALAFGLPTPLASSLPASPGSPVQVDLSAVDIDSDGDLDIALTPFFVQALVGQAVWLNEPGAPAVANFVSVIAKDIVLGEGGFADLDGDGDLDAYDVSGGRSLLVAENRLVPRTGAVFCEQPNANSTGETGRLAAYGVPASGGSSLRLVASRLPQSTFGFVLGSAQSASGVPLANSAGLLCLGSGIGRYSRPSEIGATGTGGTFELNVAADDLRTDASTTSATAGLTWAFQAWHRDTGSPAAPSNLTSGVIVTYQ